MTTFELVGSVFEFVFMVIFLLGYLLIPSVLMALAIMLNDYFFCDDGSKSKYIGLIKKHLLMFVIALIICSLSELAAFRNVHEFGEYLYYVFLFTVIFFLPLAVFICLIKNIVRFVKASRNNSSGSKKRMLIQLMISMAMIPACVALIIVFSSEMTFM